MVVTQSTTQLEDLQSEIQSFAERILPGVVLIRNKNGNCGSGVRWSEDLIISNHHVAHGDTCRVVFHDHSEATARVIARDPENDLAALRVEPPVPAVETPLVVTASRNPNVGEMVVAIGHPMGTAWAITVGMVSRVRVVRRRDISCVPVSPCYRGTPATRS
jgi:S1-C subfamily serine protease